MPEYPHVAKVAHVEGTVVLEAVIGKDGAVKDLRAVSGPPMLANAAIAAVKQWRYKPYYLNGQPTEVDTTIKVNFKLS
jgi:protein TonB